MYVRKNQASLTPTEKGKFVKAVLDLKAEKQKIGDPYTYDKYVQWHKDTVDEATGRNDAHKGPALFAWHRVFLRWFEADLQRISGDPNLGLPYWDWRFDNSPNSSIWGNDFMGGNGKESDNWAVMDGPFRRGQWELRVRDTVDEPTYLRRQFRSDPLATSLPTQKDVQDTLDATPFDVAPWNENSASGFRNMAEGWIPPRYNPEMYIPRMHNRVHAWVGGSMVPITSPNDPVFFLHHCFMDKLWADWQVLQFQRGGTRDYSPYLPDGGAAPGHNLNDEMSPWYKLNPPLWFGQSPWDVRYHHGPLGYSYNTDSDMQYTRYPSDVGDRLTPGQQISSSKDGNYYLVYQADGNLELWQHAPSGIKLWESGTAGRPGSSCKLEGNGTLVIYGADYKTPIWASSSHGSDNAYRLLVRNDGKVAIYQPDGKQLWSVPPPPVGNP